MIELSQEPIFPSVNDGMESNDVDLPSEWITCFCATNTLSKQEVLSRIRNIFEIFVGKCKEMDTDISVPINPKASAKNSQVDPILGTIVQYEEESKYSLSFTKNPKSFAIFMRVLSVIYNSLLNGEIITKRSIFYRDTTLFGSQDAVDTAIDKVCRSLEVNRASLGVIACPKSFVAGPLQWEDSTGNIIDVTNHIAPIPALVDRISKIQTKAIAVLVVEKESIFMRLVQSNIVKEVILITPRGVPDYNSRFFVRLLDDSFNIPIVGLFDADAYGAFIMHLFRYGSMAAAHDGLSMACPHIMWLGVRPSDVEKFPLNWTRQLTHNEEKVLNKLLAYPHISDEWRDELTLMMNIKRTAEIEALCNSSNYLMDFFLPQKFANYDWI